ncbi:hypothetical protein M758_6G016200 [Ceratodon purpureus]|nr:hypothetical protein M758_6G016200 [Ceratodon purpureus]
MGTQNSNKMWATVKTNGSKRIFFHFSFAFFFCLESESSSRKVQGDVEITEPSMVHLRLTRSKGEYSFSIALDTNPA